MKIIEVKNISKVFNGIVALNNVSFELDENKTIGLIGPNGSGKSTTIGILLGLIKESSGKIYIKKTLVSDANRPEFLKMMNFASPYTELPKRLTVMQNLKIYARLYDIRNTKDRLEEIYNYFELENLLNKKTGELSSGQKTKVSLAKALINKPEILLLDEPTASLDPVVSDYLRRFITEYKKKNNISILFSSHDMQEAQNLCDKIIILEKGVVKEQGNVMDILEKYKKGNLKEIYFETFGEK